MNEEQLKGKDFSRSLYVVEDVKAGEKASIKNIKSIRPGFGLHPKFLNEILNMKFKKDIEKGTRVSFDLF